MLDSATYDAAVPTRVEEIVGNTEIWTRLQKTILDGSASHTIMVGPPGCGKSLFLRLALRGFQVLEIECGANSGLRDERDGIRAFARGGLSADGKHRWVVFSHADALTADTQAFLRRMLETTSAHTRFMFECRDAGAISEPIISRAAVVSLSVPHDREIIAEIVRRSGCEAAVAAEVCELSFGNLRNAITQALAVVHCGHTTQYTKIVEMLSSRPCDGDADAWMKWAIATETTCRDGGIDLRDVLRVGWKHDPAIYAICSVWSRLGGTSPRALFFDAVNRVYEHRILA